jgi:TolB-like protein
LNAGFLAELKRRNVIRMAGLYLVGAWLVTQVVSTLLPLFEAPSWIARSIVIALALGFVPALAFAWIFELTPQGIRRDADVPPQQSIAPEVGRRLDRAIMVVLALALGYFIVDKFVLSPRHARLPLDASTESDGANKSIAVLPFIDLSPGKDQEYFSDGMSEELLNALAKVKDLKVAGRTSSFSFKGKNEDMRTIGTALGVANIVEGSVRKQGDKVRITAQLVRASSGFHLWSETYDGDLKDVFEL